MASWIKVAAVDEFSDRVKVIYHNNLRIAVFHLEDGFYAIDDECSHASASLAEGEIIDHQIECPKHGARFDIKTGKNLSFPAVTPVQSFPVKVENNVVYVQVED